MNFIETDFIIFFGIVFVLYWLVKKATYQNILLLVASIIFCGWVHPWFAAILVASSIFDYLLNRAIEIQADRKKLWLGLSLATNIGTLLFFKYFNFFAKNVSGLLNSLHLPAEPLLLQVLLPIGISFYTLRRLAYTIDVYRNGNPPNVDLVAYLLHVTFFPQLVAGPIESHRLLLPQIIQPRQWSWEYASSAWPLLLMGLLKKIVVANSVKIIADKIFALQEPSKILLLVGTLAFTLELLADFSAYTDLSRGIAWLLGFKTSKNFRSPYLAISPTDFWNRWHITLSSWLRDYIFFPLRRSLLQKKAAPALALTIPPLLTMLASGFWHGVGWTYILWGLYYGLLIVIYQGLGFGGNWMPRSRFRTVAAWAVMFILIVFGWAIFRAPSLSWIGKVLFAAPLAAGQADWIAASVGLLKTSFYAAPLVVKLVMDRSFGKTDWLQALYLAAATVLLVIHANTFTLDFIYVQF